MSNRDWKDFRVGLTGGIASGKSAVANLFAAKEIPVIDTDVIAHQLTEPGQDALAEVVNCFGAQILTADGQLIRSKLREIVFNSADERARLEAILHPRIRARSLEIAASAGGPYQVIVVPLLLETGFAAFVDRILVVDCSPELQERRLAQRDAGNQHQQRQIIASQIGREERLKAAHDILDNSGDLATTAEQVDQLHESYQLLAESLR
jgi:dephospho-CoA kinase